MKPGLSKASKTILLAATFLTLISLAATHRQSSSSVLDSHSLGPVQDAYLLPESDVLRAIGLGHSEAIADLVWLRALSYFAVNFHKEQDYRWLDRYIETIVELDPDFRQIYEWAGIIAMYGGQRIDNDAVMVSNRYLEMGRQRYPDYWSFPFMLGINYCYELQPPATEEEIHQWDQLCAEYLRGASTLPGSPSWLGLAVGRRLDRAGNRDEAVLMDTETFLNDDEFGFATLEAEVLTRDHHPTYSSTIANTRNLVAAGVKLRERLPMVEWFHLLQYRRRLYADRDSDSGYLPWSIRVLVRGEAEQRVVSLSSTPIDAAFFSTLSTALEGASD